MSIARGGGGLRAAAAILRRNAVAGAHSKSSSDEQLWLWHAGTVMECSCSCSAIDFMIDGDSIQRRSQSICLAKKQSRSNLNGTKLLGSWTQSKLDVHGAEKPCKKTCKAGRDEHLKSYADLTRARILEASES